LVDWPPGERDGYVFTRENTVVNAFRLKALLLMQQLATALGNTEDVQTFKSEEGKGLSAFQKTFFDPAVGPYRDGVGTDHTSEHANLFPLAFGLVPESLRGNIARWIASRGMAVSVYSAQYLLQGLFENGQSDAAMRLMTAEGDRSWKHMVDSGATITWEAWDQKYKPNQDWNHAWGAAPANLLPRYVLGVHAVTAGWKIAAVEPHTSGLSSAGGRVPTLLGPITISWNQYPRFTLHVSLPSGMTAEVRLPIMRNVKGFMGGGVSHQGASSGRLVGGGLSAVRHVCRRGAIGAQRLGRYQSRR
jgi:hypothetical protein